VTFAGASWINALLFLLEVHFHACEDDADNAADGHRGEDGRKQRESRQGAKE
jgi:hypothetical protein